MPKPFFSDLNDREIIHLLQELYPRHERKNQNKGVRVRYRIRKRFHVRRLYAGSSAVCICGGVRGPAYEKPEHG